MGAKDVFTNPQFVSSMVSMPPKPVCNEHLCNNNELRRNGGGHEDDEYSIDQEWHQKYAFIIGLLRKPHSVLIKESLGRERNKVSSKLHAYRLERDYVRDLVNKAKLDLSDEDTQQSLTSQMKHLDMMCVTLERQMDVLGNVDQALPSAENIYSGEPDSLDGTSSEIMMIDDLESSRGHYNNNNNNNNNRSHSNFQLIVNGRSPLDAFAMLHLERSAHRETRKELNMLRKKYEVLRDEFDSGEGLSHSTSLLFSRINGELEEDELFSNNLANDDGVVGHSMETEEIERIAQQVRLKEMTISQLRSTLEQLEKARLDKGPMDSAREIARLHATLVQLERVRDELTLQNFTLKSKLAELSARITDSTTYRLEKHNNNNNNNPVPTPVLIQSNVKNRRSEDIDHHVEHQRPDSNQSGPPPPPPPMNIMSDSEMRLKRKSTYKVAHHNNNEANAEIKQLRSFINDLHAKEIEYQKKIAQLETELRNSRNEGIELPSSHNSTESRQQRLQSAPQPPSPSSLLLLQESNALKLDLQRLSAENQRLKDDLNLLHSKLEKEQTESLEKLRGYEKEMGAILDQNKALQEDCSKERCLRKKYFNMVEELKGKIRVFCRIRPPSKTEKAADVVVRRSDPYTVTVDTPAKGLKEFHFDRVFIPDDGQDQIFEDTKNLIKSAFDGFNVCICAYGQTGSGKTHTILGDELNPGIAPRTFREIFQLAETLSHTYDTQVSFYALELYNDKLIDLLNPPSSSSVDHPESKLEIRRDRKGIVWVSGARVLSAADSSSLELNFRQALQSRHTASTKMNDRSSRSHLVVSLIIETTSKVNGTILRGKISLVDLAGSERTAKSGVSANTLREANAINKSLSAFGDVINALTTDQSFVPYRNNKLTLLMQDSIGGNAKTLMFVNVSPSSFNMEETIISLSYASRVKQVTNSVSRNSESKEIARLKNIISRLKRGESCTPEEDT